MKIRNVLVVLFVLMLLGLAHAVSISPTKISADRQNNTFEITAINNSEQPISLSVVLAGLEDKQLVFSARTLNVPGKASDKVTVTFYDNVYVKNARICFLESSSGEEDIGAALKVCSTVDVATTEDGKEARGEPEITGSVIGALVDSLSDSLERLKGKAGFAANSCFNGDIEKINAEINEIETNIKTAQELLDSGNLDKAGISIENANKKMQEADLLLPTITLISESNIPSQPTAEQILSLLQELEMQDQNIREGVISTSENFTISRTLQAFRFTDKRNELQNYATKTIISIVNQSPEPSPGIYVIERMPDFIDKNELYGGNKFITGNSEPLVAEWFVPSVEGSGQHALTYCIGKEIGEAEKAELGAYAVSTELILAGAISEVENTCAEDKDCDDGKICTNDVCSNSGCTTSNLPEGTSCGEGLMCREGNCNAIKGGYEFYIPDITGLVVIGIVVLLMASLVVVAYFRIYRPPKPKDTALNISTPLTMSDAELKTEIASRLRKWISGDSKITVESVKKSAKGFSAVATVGTTKVSLTLDKNLELEGVEEIK